MLNQKVHQQVSNFLLRSIEITPVKTHQVAPRSVLGLHNGSRAAQERPSAALSRLWIRRHCMIERTFHDVLQPTRGLIGAISALGGSPL